MSESDLQIAIARYLRVQYPDVIFRSDYGAGLRMTINQARRQRAQNGFIRGYPDLFIAEMRNGYGGLYIELKTEKARTFLKDGKTPATPHIKEQAQMLEKLEKKGYKAVFGIGFEQTKKIIDDYLKSS